MNKQLLEQNCSQSKKVDNEMVLYKYATVLPENSDGQKKRSLKQHKTCWHSYSVDTGDYASPSCLQKGTASVPGTGSKATPLPGIFFSGPKAVCLAFKTGHLQEKVYASSL